MIKISKTSICVAHHSQNSPQCAARISTLKKYLQSNRAKKKGANECLGSEFHIIGDTGNRKDQTPIRT